MSSLTKAIRFRYLAAQLKPSEFNQFVSKLVKPEGNVILDALFTYFTNSTTATSTHHQIAIEDILEIISNIIRARKDKSIPSQNLNITALNGNIIGNIASNLNQTDYARFSVTSRSVLIGCNSPNTLQKIDLDLLNSPYSSIDLQQFPAIKYLEFSSKNFSDLTFIANNMQHLRLKDLFFNNACVQKFMHHKNIHFDRIEKLDVIVPQHKNNPGNLWDFFSKFKMIQRLGLDDAFDISFSGNETKTLFPNLKSFLSNGSSFGNDIINLFSNKLKGLKFIDNPQILFQPQTKFDTLNELRVKNARKTTMEHILKSAKNLEKISVSSNMENNDFQNVIQSLISTQQFLRYIEINTKNDRFASICNGIEKGLFEAKKQEKSYFKIKIKIECKTEFDINNLMILISRIKNMLKLCSVKDFMFLCVLYGDKKPEKVVIDEVIGEYKECESTIVLYSFCQENKESLIVMTNPGCKINGYSESWL